MKSPHFYYTALSAIIIAQYSYFYNLMLYMIMIREKERLLAILNEVVPFVGTWRYYMSLIFSKYHGFDREYLIYDINKNKKHFNVTMIKTLYRGNLGLGTKGIIVGPYMKENKIHFTVYNQNGVLLENNPIEKAIFFQYLKDNGYLESKEMKLKNNYISEHLTNIKEVGNMVTISMGTLSFNSKDIGMTTISGDMINIPLYFGGREYWSTCISTERPHCVIPLQEVSSDKIREIGKYSSRTTYFSKDMMFEIVKVLDKKNIQVEIYEQGTGYIAASVDAAVAVASVVYKLGMVDKNLTVHMTGGKLNVNINKDMEVDVTSKITSTGSVYMLDEYIDEKLAMTC